MENRGTQLSQGLPGGGSVIGDRTGRSVVLSRSCGTRAAGHRPARRGVGGLQLALVNGVRAPVEPWDPAGAGSLAVARDDPRSTVYGPSRDGSARNRPRGSARRDGVVGGLS